MIESKRAQGARLLDATSADSNIPRIQHARDRVAEALDTKKRPNFDDLMLLKYAADGVEER